MYSLTIKNYLHMKSVIIHMPNFYIKICDVYLDSNTINIPEKLILCKIIYVGESCYVQAYALPSDSCTPYNRIV